MRIARFQFNMLPVNTYVLWDTASRECAIVDAGCYYPKEEETLAEFIDDNKLTVKYLLATHLHFDHCFGNSFVAKKYGVILYAAEADEFGTPMRIFRYSVSRRNTADRALYFR